MQSGTPGEERQTIAASVSMRGQGLHSGEVTTLTLRPAPSGLGIVFHVPREGGGQVEIPAQLDAVAGARNATRLGWGGTVVHTVEHLLAALAACGVDDVVVDLDGFEPPAADGSALPFVALIEEAGLRVHPGQRCALRVIEPVSHDEGERSIRFEPADRYALDCEIDFASPLIGVQRLRFEALSPEVFARELAPARTFGFLADAEALRAAGLARGASLENTVVVGDARVENPGGLRWPDEFVRHKALDAVGDLSLLGMPLLGRVVVRRGGHALHHAGMRALMAAPRAYEIVPAALTRD